MLIIQLGLFISQLLFEILDLLLEVGHLILLPLQLAQEALQFLDAVILVLVVLFQLGADFVELLDLRRFVSELFLERLDLSQGVVELFA